MVFGVWYLDGTRTRATSVNLKSPLWPSSLGPSPPGDRERIESLRGGNDVDAHGLGGLGQACVVGDDRVQLVSADVDRGSEVNRIEAPESRRSQCRCALIDSASDGRERDGIENSVAQGSQVATVSADGPKKLGAQKVAGHNISVRGIQPCPKSIRAWLIQHEFCSRRGVEVVHLQIRSARWSSMISDSRRWLASLGAGGGRSRRLLVGRVASPDSISTSILLCRIGPRTATGLPLSVIVMDSPALARATTFDAFCLSARIPTSLMVYIVEHCGFVVQRPVRSAQPGSRTQRWGSSVEPPHRSIHASKRQELLAPSMPSRSCFMYQSWTSDPVSPSARKGEPSW